MSKSVYMKNQDGAVIWLPIGYDKFKQECDERIRLLWKDIKDEDLNEEE